MTSVLSPERTTVGDAQDGPKSRSTRQRSLPVPTFNPAKKLCSSWSYCTSRMLCSSKASCPYGFSGTPTLRAQTFLPSKSNATRSPVEKTEDPCAVSIWWPLRIPYPRSLSVPCPENLQCRSHHRSKADRLYQRCSNRPDVSIDHRRKGKCGRSRRSEN